MIGDKTSFVFYETFAEQLKELDNETRYKFYDYIINYGLYDIEPEVSGLEKSLWLSFKKDIDYAKSRREMQIQNGKRGGRPEVSKEIQNKIIEDLNNGFSQKELAKKYKISQVTISNIKNKNNSDIIKNPNEILKTQTEYQKPNNDIKNLNVDVDIDVDKDKDVDDNNNPIVISFSKNKDLEYSEKEEEEEAFFELEKDLNPSLSDIAKRIYNIFVDIGLNKPNTFTSFYQRDFKIGLENLREAKIFLTQDVVIACKNYAKVIDLLKKGQTWWNCEAYFNSFCKKNIIIQFMPDRFKLSHFEKNKSSPTDEYDFNKSGRDNIIPF